MKTRLFTLPFFLLLMASCQLETEIDSPRPSRRNLVTISASVPDTKVALTPDGKGLHLAWEAGDCLRVLSGSAGERFDIKDGFTDHEATFSGAGVEGTTFDVMYPGTFASVAEAEASDFGYQVQDGNGSTAHLRYAALLSGVDDYKNVTFSKDWAEAHGGTFKNAGAIRLVLTLPAGVTSVEKTSIDLAGRKLSLQLDNIDVSASSQVLTAYIMTPWNDIVIPAGSDVEVTVTDPDKNVYGITIPFSTEKTLVAGHVSNFTISHDIEEYLFAGGSGTSADPWLIANARQLENMMNLYKNADMPADKDSFKYWFKMIEDVDASGITWTPLNTKTANNIGFFQAIDFDGDGHTISGLTSSGTYASFAGVLYGSIRNVTFDGATINASQKKGVVAGFIGTTGLPGSCENVVVKNSSVSGRNYSGGFAGHVRTTGTIVNCRVENTTVSSEGGYIGGFAGYVDVTGDDKWEVPARFIDCHVDNVTVTQVYATAGEYYTGGFIGGAYSAAAFTDCSVKATITANKAAIKDIGGFIGRSTYAGCNFNHCEVLEGSSVTAIGDHVGGFIGYAEVASAFIDCSSAANVSNTAQYTGGFVGYASGASSYTTCTASGNVTGSKNFGGFAGAATEASFNDCLYKNGTVTASTSGQSFGAGFCGYMVTNAAFRNCRVSGATVTINSGQRNGGFVGQLGNNSNKGKNNIVVYHCAVENTTVNSALNSGSFVGVLYGNIERSWVSGGTMNATGNQCAGFSGFIDTGNLTHCYTTAKVVGGSYASIGGMVGIMNLCNASYCYAACDISGTGTGVGAFVGKSALATAACSHCIGWHASLPFSGLNTVSAPLTDCYAGNSGSVSSQAQAQAWPTSIWDLSGSMPVLLDTPSQIPAAFIGDSITWQWARPSNTFASSNLKIPFNSSYMKQDGDNVTVYFHPGFFAAGGYVDKGISGQNTTQMLSRFQEDILALNPKVVVIMGGTNDLAQGFTEAEILANLSAMAEQADAAGIKVVLCSVTPCNNSSSKLKNPNTKGAHIITLNGMIQDYVAAHGFSYCDYWTPMVADDGLSLKPEYCLYDYLHPGPDGYDVMEPIIKAIIDNLL